MPDRPRDREREEALGMNRQIDRREFINGILIGAGAITASGWLVACTPDGGIPGGDGNGGGHRIDGELGRNRCLPSRPHRPARQHAVDRLGDACAA